MNKSLMISALLAVFSASAMAHNGATGIVMERMTGMVEIAKSMKALVQMSRSGEVDPARATELAGVIRSHAGADMLAKFPSGSLQKASEASPAIWEDWARFEALAWRLDGLAAGIEASVARDGEKVMAVFGVSDPLVSLEVMADMPLEVLLDHAAKTCLSCHQAFRVKK